MNVRLEICKLCVFAKCEGNDFSYAEADLGLLQHRRWSAL